MKFFSCCKSNVASDVVIAKELPAASDKVSPSLDLVDVEGNIKEKSSATRANILGNGSAHRFMERKLSVGSSLYYFDALDEAVDSSRRGGGEQELEVFFDADGSTEYMYNEGIPMVSTAPGGGVQGQLNMSVHSTTCHSVGTLDSALLAPAYRSFTSRRRSRGTAKSSEEWGFPGSLTPTQLKAYHKFHKELKSRGGVYEEMVYYYNEIEEEPYALCRYLRLNNFNVDRVFKFMDRHVEKWEDAKRNNFYPDSREATGAPMSVLLTQFSTLYTGYAKGGYPCCYFDTGNMSVEGIECVTDLHLLPNIIWYYQMHEMKERYAKAQIDNPGFARLEQLSILNLENISPRLFNVRTYAAMQEIDATTQVFPEMLHKLLVLNAPTFFSLVWKAINRFLDPNTTKHIEIYSSKEKGLERLLELVDRSEIPSDYGGDALSTKEVILREGREQAGRPVPQRQIVELMVVKRRKSAKFEFELSSTSISTTSSSFTEKHCNHENVVANRRVDEDTSSDSDEKVCFVIFTRSIVGVRFSLRNEDGNEIEGKVIKGPTQNNDEGCTETTKVPYCIDFGMVQGPGKYIMTAEAEESFTTTENFLVIGEVYTSRDDLSSFHVNPTENGEKHAN